MTGLTSVLAAASRADEADTGGTVARVEAVVRNVQAMRATAFAETNTAATVISTCSIELAALASQQKAAIDILNRMADAGVDRGALMHLAASQAIATFQVVQGAAAEAVKLIRATLPTAGG